VADVAERLLRLFAGLEHAYGLYTLRGDAVPGEKHVGRASPVTGAVTVTLWSRHLAGEVGLGITPVTTAGTCVWGVIDVDDYSVDHAKLIRAIAAARLPLIVCRTKSGGAHLFLFLTEPAPAADVRATLTEWAETLGLGGSEVFPKQDSVGADGFGSWLNMPYQGGDRSLRYAMDPETGVAVGVEEFLDLAYDRSVEPVSLATIGDPDGPNVAEGDDDPTLPGGPPCLIALLKRGVGDGIRNEMLFNLTLYRKRVNPDTAYELAIADAASFDPPMDETAAIATIKSALRRPYNYRCRNQPLAGVCDRPTCDGRRYGVGTGLSVVARPGADPAGALQLGTLLKVMSKPNPMWYWDVNGTRVELTTEELLNQRQFILRAFECTNILGKPRRPTAWNALVARMAAEAPQLEVPDVATGAGQVFVHLGRFCTGRAQGKSIDELLLGKPYTEGGRTYFTAPDFLAYCHQNRVGVTEMKLYLWLNDRGLEHGVMTLKGRQVDVWSVPEFPVQTAPFDVPRDPEAAGAAF
jgi:hypothetical protein